jgi:hypothetical protein
MNWMDFVSSIINSAVWPIVVLVVVLVLRKQVVHLIKEFAKLKLETLKYKDFEATFSQGLKKAEEQLDDTVKEEIESEVKNNAKPKNKQSDINLNVQLAEDSIGYSTSIADPFYFENLRKVAFEAPHLGVVISWALVEKELDAALKRLGVELEQLEALSPGNKWLNPRVKIKYLINDGYLDGNLYTALIDLYALRNVAAHDIDAASKITYSEWKKYSSLIDKVLKQLRSITEE